GPMDNIPMFGDRKNGRAAIEYPHPLLEGILAETYGIFVYQEQVMQAAQLLAGYSLGEADLLRRAMGKKIQSEMDAQRARFVECLPPDINASNAYFTVENGTVRYALGALKGVGEKAMEALVAEREANGPFKSLEDFAARIDPRLLNRRQLESLAGAGAFDSIHDDRPAVYASAETILAHAASAQDQRVSGQAGLFGVNSAVMAPIRLPRDASWS